MFTLKISTVCLILIICVKKINNEFNNFYETITEEKCELKASDILDMDAVNREPYVSPK